MTIEACRCKYILRWFTNGDFFQTFGQQWALYPGTSTATLCLTLPRQRLNWFTIVSSLRKFAECLYCNVNPLPILLVLVSSHGVHLSHTVYTVVQVTFICSYVHTSILSHIHTQHIHHIIHTWLH
jgi:hypothetical protein